MPRIEQPRIEYLGPGSLGIRYHLLFTPAEVAAREGWEVVIRILAIDLMRETPTERVVRHEERARMRYIVGAPRDAQMILQHHMTFAPGALDEDAPSAPAVKVAAEPSADDLAVDEIVAEFQLEPYNPVRSEIWTSNTVKGYFS